MIITKINQTDQSKLYKSLYAKVASYIKRGVSIDIFAHSAIAANVVLRVSGTKGTAEKNIVLFYDSGKDSWIALSEGYEYEMLGLSDITTIVKSSLQRLGTLTSKL